MLRKLLVFVPLVTLGCQDSRVATTEPSRTGFFEISFYITGFSKLDALYVIDTSESMAEELETIHLRFEHMLSDMVSLQESEIIVGDLHLGVITTGGSEYWLVHNFSQRLFEPDQDGETAWNRFESWLKNLAPETDADRALVRHALATLASDPVFLRERSVLHVVFITDDDDCSAPWPTDGGQEPGTGCGVRDDELLSTESLHKSLAEFCDGDSNRVTVAVVAGIPTDESWRPGDSIEDLENLRQIGADGAIPSCTNDMATAWPPVRLAELTYSFSDNGVLGSICSDDWLNYPEILMRRIPPLEPPLCLPRPLLKSVSESCHVRMTPENGVCQNLADSHGHDRTEGWLIDRGIDERGQRNCEVLSADIDDDGHPDDNLYGWYIESVYTTCEHGEFRLSDPWMNVEPGRIVLECWGDY